MLRRHHRKICRVRGYTKQITILMISHRYKGRRKDIGVKGQVDLKCNTVDVTYDENQVTIEAVKETIEEQGYDVV